MKKREGFVSNSSSTSYCVIVSKEEHEKGVKKLSENKQKVIEQLISEETIIFDHEVVVFEVNTGNYSSFENISYEPTNDESAEDVWNEYHESIISVFDHRTDF